MLLDSFNVIQSMSVQISDLPNFQVRYSTPPRRCRAESKVDGKPLEGQVNFLFKPSLSSEDCIPISFSRETRLHEASLRIRSLFNAGPDKCVNLVLGEESFTEVHKLC